MIEGILLAHPDQLRSVNNDLRCLVRAAEGKPERSELQPADEVVDTLMEKLLADLPYGSGDEVSILINIRHIPFAI